MLLALRRWLGLRAPVVADADAGADRQPETVGDRAGAGRAHRPRRGALALPPHPVVLRVAPDQRALRGQDARQVLDVLPAAGADPASAPLIFGSMLQVPSDGVPYFLFFLAGMSCWRIFERGVMRVTRSLEQDRALIKKVYFPRLIAPISSIAPALHRVRRAVRAADPHLHRTTT